MELNYFTCTLGQAAIHGKTDPSFSNINTFIKQQAERIPENAAVGFYTPSSSPDTQWQTHVLTYADVHRGSMTVAEILSRASKQGLSSSGTVALLCPSTADFLFTWLGLLRLGHSVLLLAPQLAPAAIAHLCKERKVTSLLYDKQYADLARGTGKHMAAEEESEFWIFSINSVMGERGVYNTISNEPSQVPVLSNANAEDMAFLFHTSGTSTGLPKPIPQSHYAAVGVLPRVDGSQAATFTTTPLYHGGIADLFRAWSSDAMIWLFPGKDVPITASNVVRCLDVSQHLVKSNDTPSVKYFSSVPYVLQMMEQDQAGLKHLQSMAIVGVGGAALPDEVGHRLVKKGVNLVSRFGSAECGFLLSSHRNYAQDQEWQYLRDYTLKPSDASAHQGGDINGHGINSHDSNDRDEKDGTSKSPLRFEPRDGGLSELVVLSTWPHRAKHNRDDGSYATADLFEPHATIPNAWRYHSRADSQLTLITGKKFDPTPVEAAIAASSDAIEDVFVFGEGKPYPGALIFRSEAAQKRSDEELSKLVWPVVEKLNHEGQSHTRISRQMLVPMDYDPAGLAKSSKGTLMRNKVTQKHEQDIERAYDRLDGGGEHVADADVLQYVLDSVQLIYNGSSFKKLNEDTDLYAYGLDSVASIQLRRRLSRLLPEEQNELPFSVVEDYGTAKKLGKYILNRRHGEDSVIEDNEEQLMLDLVERYSQLPSPASTHDGISINGHTDSDGKDTVVLTGTTGALGAHILHIYRSAPNTAKVYCLVRGADPHAAKERVNKALSQRGLPGLDSSEVNNARVEVLQCQLSDPQLGLSKSVYGRLASTATLIVHSAWAVNFRLKLHHFEREHIAGTRHLLDLALHSNTTKRVRFLFISSVASCTGLTRSSLNNAASMVVGEIPYNSPSSASPLGYGRSKWVAEGFLHRISQQFSARNDGPEIAILRVGQLSGDTIHGVWNTSEAWPLMLKSLDVTSALPALESEKLDWLPVDIAARAVVEAAEALGIRRQKEGGSEGAQVFHVLNPNNVPTWADMLSWLNKSQPLDTLEPREWLKRLEGTAKQQPDHPAMKLLGLWKEAYGSETTSGETKPRLEFAMERTRQDVPALRDIKPLDEAYFGKLWAWLQTQEL